MNTQAHDLSMGDVDAAMRRSTKVRPRTKGPAPAVLSMPANAPEVSPGAGGDPKPLRPALPLGPVVTMLSTIEAREVQWLWPGHVPLGKLTIVAGRAGFGKSTISIDLAARLSTGRPMPGQTATTLPPSGVLIIACEDDPEDTIRPRLDAAGADCTRIGIFNFSNPDGRSRIPWTLSDPESLERALGMVPDCKLIIIDPIGAYYGDLNSDSNSAIRGALLPIVEMIQRLGAAVIIIAHLNKAQHANAVDRIGGSGGLAAAARMVFVVDADPDDDTAAVLAHAKGNLCTPPPARRCRLTEADNGVARVAWGDTIPMNGDELLAANIANRETGGALGDAVEFVRSRLADGPMDSTQLDEEANKAGVTPSALKRARKKLKIDAFRCHTTGGWKSRLPDGGGPKGGGAAPP